ncbi:unnamed protein product [Musa banksii]
MMCSLVMVFRCKRIWAMRGSVTHPQQQHYFSTQPARLAGKVAVITGAASGIGKATAAEFIRHGAKVILADVHHELGKATAYELGPAATFVGCDVTQEPHVAAAVDLAVAKHGHLDIMFNNAGVAGSLAMSIPHRLRPHHGHQRPVGGGGDQARRSRDGPAPRRVHSV